MSDRPNIVLVHGAWADGSCWSGVIERLQADGYQVRAPQFPLSSLADDVARLRQVLEFQDGPTIVVGHSYGGQIMTALGDGRAERRRPRLHRRVRPRRGRVARRAARRRARRRRRSRTSFIDSRGFAWLSEDDFVNHFAADVDPITGTGDVRRAAAARAVGLRAT